MSDRAGVRGGLFQALGAYCIWGFLPLFFYLLRSVSPWEVVAHRIVWSTAILLILLGVRQRLPELRAAFADRRALAMMTTTALLIAVNWLIYIWAVTNGHVIAASLGYFLNPLINVLLGFALLGERLSRVQWLSVAIAAAGVAVLAAGALNTLWISLSLALSFGGYGVIRKMAKPGPLIGLTMEVLILLLPAVALLAWWHQAGTLQFGAAPIDINLLLIAGGPVTAVPLLLFAAAARKLRYATMGIIQYVGPTIQFLLGLFLFREPLTTAHIIAFPLIWGALLLYSVDALRQARSRD